MLGGMLAGLVDAEGTIRDKITSTLEDLADELKTDIDGLFVMIKPINHHFEFRIDVYKFQENGVPVTVREITLKEIMSK